MSEKYKVKLTVITNNPAMAQVRGDWSTVQEVDLMAEDCATRFIVNPEVGALVFGNALVYTAGVQAFVFENVEDD